MMIIPAFLKEKSTTLASSSLVLFALAATGCQSIPESSNDSHTITLNNSQTMGNSIDNLNKIYQKSDFVEFYSDGSEEYGEMDWRAMRLVFDTYQGKRYLVAIINDQWTI